MKPTPLTEDEETRLRAEATAEQNHPDERHATWQRLVLRLLATIDHERSNRREQVRRKRVGHAARAAVEKS